MFNFRTYLVCTFLLCALLPAEVNASSECASQEISNMVIDVNNAVGKGARFTDPINTDSAQACVSACCSRVNGVGERTCNLAVYNTRSSNTRQNCYLFFCPEPESCPMSLSHGVLSYTFWTEKPKSIPDSTKDDMKEVLINDKVQNSSGKKSISSIKILPEEPEIEKELKVDKSDEENSPSVVNSPSKTSEVEQLPINNPKHITSQLIHLADNIDKQLEKIEVNSTEAKDSKGKVSILPTNEKLLVEPMPTPKHQDSKKMASDTKDTKSSKAIEKKTETLEVHYPAKELSTLTTSVRTSHQVTTTTHQPAPSTKSTVIPSTTQETKVPNSKVHSSQKSVISSTTVKNKPEGHLLITTKVPATNAAHQAKPTIPATQQKTLWTSLLKAEKSTPKDVDHPISSKGVQESNRSVPELTSPQRKDSAAGDTKNAPQNLDALDTIPGNGDKSGLVAALVFGVVFLVLIIGLVSRKISEAHRRHRYTKLDYLINGMYVDT